MKRIKSYREWTLTLLVLVTVSVAVPAKAQTFSVLYDFDTRSGDPNNPTGILAQGGDGALYGTSRAGGANAFWGTVFKFTPAGRLNVLYSFCSQANCADGSEPEGGLTLRPDGHFIGTTSSGGAGTGGGNGSGTIFDVTQTGNLTVLYRFTGGKDGANPSAPPILGPDGSYYGTTPAGGGASRCGTIYKITNSGASYGGFTLLHDFDNTDGCVPYAPLALGTDGNFYGVTNLGGTSGFGVVFQSTPAGKVTVLHNFSAAEEGFGPYGPLVQGGDGNFYGTTQDSGGGVMFGGTVFQITPAGALTYLHTLNGTTDGAAPNAGLAQATDGNFYGATQEKGNSNNPKCPNGCGTLFQVTPGGSFSVLYNFDFTTGYLAIETPFQHTNGVLYGVTHDGGTSTMTACTPPFSGCGVLYSWDAGLPPFVSLIPYQGKVGTVIEILGQGFTSSTTVSFNGTPATTRVLSGTLVKTFVPSGATTGPVTVTISGGTLTSNKQFLVTP
jgi:uncharacterized repeat protein (TIGR03803 family)